MIKFNSGSTSVWISPETITAVTYDDNFVKITAGNDTYLVNEIPNEAIRKIIDYKLSMFRYESSFHADVRSAEADPEAAAEMAENKIYKLAGL